MYIHMYVFDQAYKDNDNTFLIMILNSGLRGREFLTFFPLKKPCGANMKGFEDVLC